MLRACPWCSRSRCSRSAAEGIFLPAQGFLFNYPESDMKRIRYILQRGSQRYGQRAMSAVEAYYCPLHEDCALGNSGYDFGIKQ